MIHETISWGSPFDIYIYIYIIYIYIIIIIIIITLPEWI